MFRTSQPVTRGEFFDREPAIARLNTVIDRLRAGAPEWLAIIGPRKIGKTSLLLEVARRQEAQDVEVVVFDVLDGAPVSLETFRRLAGAMFDTAFSRDAGVSISRLFDRPAELRAALLKAESYRALTPELQHILLDIAERPMSESLIRDCLELPERLANELGVHLLIAIDEFQELAGAGTRRGFTDPFPMMRSHWQRHRNVSYVISGSSRSMLTELVTSERSPFFQHFAMMELPGFSRADGARMLVESSPSDRPIPLPLAERAVELLGGHPFYLQLFGEALTSEPAPYDDRSFKEAIQSLLFTRTGRLSLYFQNEYQRLVGESSGLAAVLEAIASGPLRVTDIAKKINSATGAVTSYLSRLGDAVQPAKDGEYQLDDPAFAAWIRWRAPGGSVVPMKAIGDAAEAEVAEHLSRMGFDLVYQSRASRGAFDLLATRGSQLLGVQVKRSALPLRFTRADWTRMNADAKKWGWSWIVAAVGGSGEIALLDPARASMRQQLSLGEPARIENLLEWLSPPRAEPAKRRRSTKTKR